MSTFEITFPFSSSHPMVCRIPIANGIGEAVYIATCYGLRGPGCEPCGARICGPV